MPTKPDDVEWDHYKLLRGEKGDDGRKHVRVPRLLREVKYDALIAAKSYRSRASGTSFSLPREVYRSPLDRRGSMWSENTASRKRAMIRE